MRHIVQHLEYLNGRKQMEMQRYFDDPNEALTCFEQAKQIVATYADFVDDYKKWSDPLSGGVLYQKNELIIRIEIIHK